LRPQSPRRLRRRHLDRLADFRKTDQNDADYEYEEQEDDDVRTYWQRLLDEKYRKFEKRVAAAPGALQPTNANRAFLEKARGMAKPTRRRRQRDWHSTSPRRGRRRRRRTRARWKPLQTRRPCSARARRRAADVSFPA